MIKNQGSCISLPKTRQILVPSGNTMRTINFFPDPDLMSRKLVEL